MNQVVKAIRLPAVFLLAFMVMFSCVNVPAASAKMGNTYGQPQFLLTPIKSSSTIAIYDCVIGKENGTNVMYTTLSGDPAVFFVIDLDNYEVIRSLPLTSGAQQVWSHVIDPNGNVYFASMNGHLFRYKPGAEELEDLGKIISGESSIYGLSTDENGNIYGGTYPKGKVFKYDPVTNTFTDYGRMNDSNAYVRSLAYYNGKVYAGTGQKGRLYELDPVTGAKTEIPLPPVEGITGDNYPFVYQLDVISDGNGNAYLFAHLSGNGISTLIVYDLVKGEWRSEQFPNFHGNRVYSFGDGKAYYKLNAAGEHKLVEIDLATFQTRVTGMAQDFSLKGGGWVQYNTGDLPGQTLVNIRFDGKVGLFNIATDTYIEKPAIVEGQPIQIHNIEKGPDGKLYMSGYPGGSAAIYDPATNTNTVITMEQAESIGFKGNYAYFNAYPKAEIYRIDITNPTKGSTKLFTVGEEQDRPYISLTVGDTLYLGTVPDYGKLGGALVVYDTTSDPAQFEVYRNVVQDQSIVGLAYKDGKIYGSTTIWGGLNATPTSSKAKIFVWDTATKQKIAEFTPDIPGKAPTMISGLTFGEDGLLWAAANGTIFAMDPDTLQVVKSKEIYPGVTDYGQWRPVHMRWGTDGLLYSDLAGKLTVFNTKTLEYQALGISTQLFTLGDDNNIYYASGTKLYKIEVTQGDNSDSNAPGELSLVLSRDAVKPGDEFPVIVKVADAEDLYALKGVITYDPDKLEVVEVTAGDAFADAANGYFTSNTDHASGVVNFIATKLGNKEVNGDAEVAVLIFSAKQTADSSKITLTTRSQLAKSDADETHEIYSPASDIAVQVKISDSQEEGNKHADVNGDGKVDKDDLIAVAKHIGSTDEKYDVTGDGIVDIHDVAVVALNAIKEQK